MTSDFLSGARVLVTGGTGSFGRRFLEMTLKQYQPEALIVLSRDEMKQWSLAQKVSKSDKIRFFIGDVRDRDRLERAFKNVDVVIHAAATKIVPTAEYNPFEAVKTNVLGAMNVIDAALNSGVSRVVALSTDKASSPVNLYGATKMTSDKLFVAANNYSGASGTKFSVVRYGNVMGSRGSVIPFFLSLPKDSRLPITDPRMTRFMITLEEGVGLVWLALNESLGGEVFVQKIPSMNIMDIASAIRPDLKTEIIGIRPGEKLHEQMISSEDSSNTWDCGSHYRITPTVEYEHFGPSYAPGVRVPNGFQYTSDSNDEWMTVGDLRVWVEANREKIGVI